MFKVPSAMTHVFSQSPQADIPRSSFNRSHGYKTTFDAGYLVPVYLDEALPGDTFNCHMTAFARLATPIFPLMDNMYLDSFFFAVPYRLIWDNWQKFNGEQKNPGDSTSYVIPTMTSTAVTGYLQNTLYDYMGLPVGVPGLTHSSLFTRAYNLIYNEWFRDENLQNSVVVDLGDGPDDPANYQLLRRGKRYDYFTSCLPFPQKGPAVDLPLGSTAPVISSGTPATFYNGAEALALNTVATSVDPKWSGLPTVSANVRFGNSLGEATGLVTDLTTATAATINDLRQAFQIQKLYERDARGGTRYTEIIRSHFGVVSPDARLQRPEYLGGGSTVVNVNPIAKTSSTDGVSPQGNLAAFGTSTMSGHGFTKSFTEHCIIIGLVSARADLNYQQGLNRMFSRSNRFDFYWPVFSHIGEQAVLNKEIYAQGSVNPDQDDEVFGYQERYAEYRYKPSQITGLFRTAATGTLDSWHLAQNFSALPTLSPEFIVENPPVARVIAVNTEPHFLFDSHFDLKCARPMPVYSVPGLIDHF